MRIFVLISILILLFSGCSIKDITNQHDANLNVFDLN